MKTLDLFRTPPEVIPAHIGWYLADLGEALTKAASPAIGLLKAFFDGKAKKLEQKQELCSELFEACTEWTKLLEKVFRRAVKEWQLEGVDAAKKRIIRQQDDYAKLNYGSLHRESPVLEFLKKDERFAQFAHSCGIFYNDAVKTKEIAYGQIEVGDKVFSSSKDSLDTMVSAWMKRLQRSYEDLQDAYNQVRTL